MKAPPLSRDRQLDNLFFGIGAMLQLAFFLAALVLFRERILYADPAHFLAEIAGARSFYLGHRLIAAISRILPFTGALAGASIKSSLILYSANLALMFAIPYLLIAYRFRDRKMALALLIFQFLFTYRTFYVPMSELQHGLVLLILYWSYLFHLNGKGRVPSGNLLLYGLLILVMNTHPVIIFAYVASCLILSEHEGYWRWKDQRWLFPAGIACYLVSSIVFYTKYEAAIAAQALAPAQDGINVYYIRLMISTVVRQYYPILAVGIVAAVMLMRKYSHVKAAVIMLFVAFNGLLVYFRFANTTFTPTFFEIYLLPVPFMISLIVAVQLHHYSERSRMAGVAGVVVIMLFQGWRIAEHRHFYQERLAIYAAEFENMKERGITRAILPFYRSDMSRIVDFYTSPFETYLLSFCDRDTGNDGMIITYLPADKIELRDGILSLVTYPGDTVVTDHLLLQDHFITLGMDTLYYFPFDRYEQFELPPGNYHTY